MVAVLGRDNGTGYYVISCANMLREKETGRLFFVYYVSCVYCRVKFVVNFFRISGKFVASGKQRFFPSYLVTFAFSQHFVNSGTVAATITTRDNLEFFCLFCSENSRCDSPVMRQI